MWRAHAGVRLQVELGQMQSQQQDYCWCFYWQFVSSVELSMHLCYHHLEYQVEMEYHVDLQIGVC